MRDWFMDQTWQEVYEVESAHEKAELFQNTLVTRMDRKRKRIYRNERRSEKWSKWNKIFKKKETNAKANFYKDTVADLKLKKPGQW